jgi:hypothetical protein
MRSIWCPTRSNQWIIHLGDNSAEGIGQVWFEPLLYGVSCPARVILRSASCSSSEIKYPLCYIPPVISAEGEGLLHFWKGYTSIYEHANRVSMLTGPTHSTLNYWHHRFGHCSTQCAIQHSVQGIALSRCVLCLALFIPIHRTIPRLLQAISHLSRYSVSANYL